MASRLQYLHMIPILHRECVNLVNHENLDRGKKISVPKSRQCCKNVGQRYSPVTFNGPPQAERAPEDDVARIEFRKELDRLSCNFYPKSEVVIHVSLEHIDMIGRISTRVRVGYLIDCPRRQSEFRNKPGVVFDLGIGQV